MSTCSTSEALELLLKGTVAYRIAVSLDGVKVPDPTHRLNLQAGESLLVRVGKLKLQQWVIA